VGVLLPILAHQLTERQYKENTGTTGRVEDNSFRGLLKARERFID
jgi:hypothetical protein